jgi:hypothetical protein
VRLLESGQEAEVSAPVYEPDTRVVRFSPVEGLHAGTAYQVVLNNDIGGPLRSGDYTWRFGTEIPRLVDTDPDSGAAKVSLVDLAEAVVWFSAALDSEQVSAGNFVLLRGGEAVALREGDPVTRAGGQYGLAPAEGWRVGSIYTVQISPAVTGPLGAAQPMTLQFATAVPETMRVNPAAGDNAVSVRVGAIEVAFDQPVDVEALRATGGVRLLESGAEAALEGLVYDADTRVVRFAPVGGLHTGTSYQVVLSRQIGGRLRSEEYTWRFNTAVPSVLYTRPEDKAEGVSISTPGMQVVFTGPVVRQDSVQKTVDFFQMRARPLGDPQAASELVAITNFVLGTGDTVASFNLRDGLRPSTEYEVVIDRRILGELAAAGYHWIFHTAGRLTDPARGGTVAGANGMVELYFPPHALPQGSGEVVIRPVANPAAGKEIVQDPELSQVGPAYEVVAGTGALRRPATLTVRWVAEDLGARDPSRLGVFRFEAAGWQRIGGMPDPALRQVRTAVDSLGTYALFEDLRTPVGRPTVEQLDCQPRAFAPAGGTLEAQTAVSFRLSGPADVTVRVYNTSGRLERVIQRGEPMAPGRVALVWDGRDEDRKVVASGLYIVVVTAGSSQAEKVVAVVR